MVVGVREKTDKLYYSFCLYLIWTHILPNVFALFVCVCVCLCPKKQTKKKKKKEKVELTYIYFYIYYYILFIYLFNLYIIVYINIWINVFYIFDSFRSWFWTQNLPKCSWNVTFLLKLAILSRICKKLFPFIFFFIYFIENLKISQKNTFLFIFLQFSSPIWVQKSHPFLFLLLKSSEIA